MNLQDARKKLPELNGLSDESALNVIHQVYYPNMDKADLAERLGYKAPEAPAPERTWGGLAKDVGITALKGAISVPEAVVGMADLVSGGQAGKSLEGVGFRPKEAKEILSEYYSDKQKKAFAEVQNAEGVMGTMEAALRNPSVIAHSIGESIPSMMAGGVVGRGLMAAAGRMGAKATAGAGTLAGAAGEGVIAAGSAGEQIRQQTPDGLLTGAQSGAGAATGVATAVLGAIGGKIAQKLGIADVDSMLVGVAQNPTARKGVVRSVLEGAASEGILEELPQSISEQVLQNHALGKPLDEGVDQAAVLGLLSGAAMGGGANMMHSMGKKPVDVPPPSDPGKDTAHAIMDAKLVPETGPTTRAANVATAIEADKVRNEVNQSLTGSSMADMLRGPANPLQDALAAQAAPAADQVAQPLNMVPNQSEQPLDMVPQGVDPATGEGSAYAVPDAAKAPDIIGRRIGKRDNLPFSIQSSAQKDLEKRGLTDTHEVVSATNIDQSLSGFLIVKKPDGAAPVAEPAPATNPVVEPKTQTASDKPATLPKELAGAKEKYNYGNKAFTPQFESDVDRAAFIVSQKTPSKRDADYLKFAMDATGMTEAEVRAHGQKVRDSIKGMAKGAEPGKLAVPKVYAPKAAPAAKTQSDAEIIANAVAYADGLGLTDKNERKDVILGDLSNAWGMTKDEVENDPAVKAALKQKPSLSAKEKNAGRFVEDVKKQAIDASKKMQDEIDAQPAPAQAPAVTAESGAPVKQPATSGVPEEGAGGSQPPQAAPIPKSVDAFGTQASWVLRDKTTGEVVMETTDPKKVAALNTEKYEAVPIGEHLSGLNKKPAQAAPVKGQDQNSPQSRWTRATTNERIAIARAGGIQLKPAENVAKKAWDKHDPVVQEKLARGIAKQEGEPAAAPQEAKTDTSADASDVAKTIHASIAERAKTTNRKYYDEQIAKGRMTKDEAERRAAADDKTWRDTPISDRTQAIAKAIEQKDPTVLVGAWAKEGQGVFGVEGSIDAFRKLTGINLKRMNSAERAKAIFDWAGWTEDQVRADVEQRRAAKKEALTRYEEKKAKEDAEGTDRLAANTELAIQGKDGKTTVKAYIDGLIEQGFTNIGRKKVGAITKTFLFNPKTDSGYPLQKGILSEYATLAAKRYADNDAAKTQGDDAKADKPPTLKELREKVDSVPPLTNEHLKAIRDLKDAAVADAEAEIEAGRAPVYKSSTGVTSVITPSAKKSGMFQVTRYTSNGVFGDSQYKSVRDAVIDDQLHTLERLEPEQADELMGQFVEAEAEFQAKKHGMEVGMAKAVSDGFVQTGRETVDTSKDKKIGVDSRGRDVFEGAQGSLKGVRYTFDERGKVNTGATVEEAPASPAPEAKAEPAPAKEVEPAKPASKTPKLDSHMETMKAVRDGAASPEQYKAGFVAVADNAEAIKAELNTQTKEALLRSGGLYFYQRHKQDTKPEIVEAVYGVMLEEYAIGKQYGSNSYVMSAGGLKRHKEAQLQALRELVDGQTAETLAEHAAEVAASREEFKAKKEARQQAIENPQTLEDFNAAMRVKVSEGMTRQEAFLSLTPEQRTQYDELDAESTRKGREDRKRTLKTQVMAAGQTTGGEIAATKHTRSGEDLFVVKLAERVSREDYITLLSSAKKLGGWYSSFRGSGAVPGFQFKEMAKAEAFLKLAAGDTTAAQEQVEQRRDAFEDDRSQSAAERLNEMADALQERAEASLNQERKANTARRARFAASADREANEQKALAQTMRNIAKAIEDGKAKFLDAVRQKVQIEFMRGAVRTAKDAELRAKYPSYADQEKRKGEPPTAETADFSEFPAFTAFRSDLASLARQLLEVDGTKKMGQQIMSVADDVTDAYLEFAKANILKVSAFGVNGGFATFGNKADAEAAIRRSGLTGKAIVLAVKRGENRVILSPSEAINRQIWTGDGDKRITLSREFGMQLVEAIGRRGNKQNRLTVPWQFQNAADRLKMLARMGIETGPEYRSALREFIGLQERATEDKVRKMELAMVGRKADGLDFFPTPETVADQMIEAAEIGPEMAVLEPSAGMGHIADRIREAGAEPEVIEISPERRELLQEKGYNTANVDDFMDLKARQGFTFGDLMRAPDGTVGILRGQGGFGSERVRLVSDEADPRELGKFNYSELEGVEHRGDGYDRIIMNPPFSDRRDAQHVQHAYTLLKPGGRIVAIMGEGVFFGSDKKAEAFREWLEKVGGTSEKLPPGSFQDPSLPVTTGVNARMVVIDKPATATGDTAMFSRGQTFKGMTKADAQDVVGGITERWDNAPEVVVVQDMNDPAVPEAVRNEDAKQKSQGASGEPEGFWYGGKAYIVAGALRSPGSVMRVLFHEALGHYGLRGTFGDGLTPILKQLAALRRAEVTAKAVQYGLDMSKEADRLTAAEEVLAEMAQSKPEIGFVKRVIALIRGFLRKHVPGFAKMKMTDEDIIANFIIPARAFVERGPGGGPKGGVAFSRAPNENRSNYAKRSNQDKFWQAFDRGDFTGVGGGIGESEFTDALQGVFEGSGLRKQGRVRSFAERGPLSEVFWPDRVIAGFKGIHTTFVKDADGGLNLLVAPTEYLSGSSLASWDDFLDRSILAISLFKNQDGDLEIAFSEAIPGSWARGELEKSGKLVSTGDKDYTGADYSRLNIGNAEVKNLTREALRRYALQTGSIEGLSIPSRDTGANKDRPRSFGVDTVKAYFSRTTDDNGNTRDATSGMGATELAGQVRDKLNETFNHPGKLSWWHKTVGSQYNLAERNPAFKKVFDAAQSFINDVSYYGTEAANMAPKMLPKLETLRDLAKTAISAADNKAVAAPVFEGTLSWARDADGKPIRIEALEKRYENLTDDEKAQMLLRKNVVSEAQLKAWKASKLDVYTGAVRNRFESTFLKAGVRWTDAELSSIFKLTPEQVELYKEFRAATDTSLDNMAKAQMLREAGKDVEGMRDAVMEAPDVDTAAMMLRETLLDMAKDDPDRADVLTDAAAGVLDTAAKINDLKKQGYAPLSRFGRFTVDVVVDGQRQYFGLFESEADSNKMAAKMRMEFGADNVAQGTMSQKEFELFQGITPESLELFGNMMGLDSTGNEAQDKAFQSYLKLTKNNRSAMKRLIHRQGIAGYSEDVGRVLAAFVYANARQTSAALHIGQMDEAITAIPKGEGELKDHALELAKYVKEPREEAAALRGLLFAQYLGGSVASAMVNFTQPLTVSIPYLSQFGGLAKAGKAWAQAVKDMSKGIKLEPGLERALRDAEERGVVSPQEVHQLMAQARGAATLQSGDGTRKGDAIAMAKNGWTRTALAWGKLFGYAEQVNRRSTFIAAYRLAVDQKIENPGAFAEKAVNETQFINNKANKMKFGRGAIGATLMTFKSYSLNWLELMHRMTTQGGPEGKLAAAYMLGALFLVAGAGGLPFAEDIEDLIDAIGQKMGYNMSTKKAKQEFLEGVFGKAGAQFVERGLTGIPGVPIDISGRMGMQNLLPGTGLLLEKKDHTRDVMELGGPAGEMAQRMFQALGSMLSGDIGKAIESAAPKAIGNMIKGADMLDKGMYRDTKGAKVIDTTAGEAVAKMIGFQPASVAQVQESNFINQRAKDFYNLKTQEIRAKWAMGIFEADQDKVKEARQMMDDWNQDNPDQKMTANMPAIVKKVREMRKDKAQRIADTAPKAMRAQMRADARELAGN